MAMRKSFVRDVSEKAFALFTGFMIANLVIVLMTSLAFVFFTML